MDSNTAIQELTNVKHLIINIARHNIPVSTVLWRMVETGADLVTL